MRRLFYAVMVIIVAAGVVAAQDFPKFEIFGGYSLSEIGGSSVNDWTRLFRSFTTIGGVSKSRTLKGFDASVAFNLNEYLGVEANYFYNGGRLLRRSVGDLLIARLSASDYALMSGPRITYRKQDKVTPFAHALFGVNHLKINSIVNIDPIFYSAEIQNLSGSDTGFGMALGGGLDINVHKVLGVRMIQVDYFMARHEAANLSNLAISFGAVIRLGGK